MPIQTQSLTNDEFSDRLLTIPFPEEGGLAQPKLIAMQDTIEELHTIHCFLKSLSETQLNKTPSTLVSDFNQWMFKSDLNYSFSHEQFNEAHVRALETVSPTNQDLIDAIQQWLTDTYDDYPTNTHQS